ncbi:MAG: flagellar motor stator protein MotA [Rhodospirillaceae bacterium]|nr:flagellar motor stator protein MotA [Rhodospirillaceae bacterium]MBT3629454.1 flagellar motor stator protein MotA [Rhodospirillaceae bacterium]MBT3928049.1 flagellar motor stator protein MotA [Rhodospirillaceae bacterium]MBT4426373.1 flagellar motor stator protein MotA [Rhodospirillaceae bacterium]MBT5040172.1 flagellar motor stator protein MotA [Rhodospirillaceae bacterium]
MLLIVGSLIVVVSVIGGFVMMGGHIEILIQPVEFIIIVGASVGAFIIANPKTLIKSSIKASMGLLKAPRHNKDSFLELLTLLYAVFKLVQMKGMLALEQHVENPTESDLFQQFPKFFNDETAVTFLCDYIRLMTLGSDKAHEMETLMDEEIETHHNDQLEISEAVNKAAEAMPALGIVAAVLGVIHTMGSITEPPEVLGHLIGAALVGTFLGVLLSYGFIGPMASALKGRANTDTKYFVCMKAGLMAYMQGYAPAVSVEFARKTLFAHERPTFYDVEDAVAELPAA